MSEFRVDSYLSADIEIEGAATLQLSAPLPAVIPEDIQWFVTMGGGGGGGTGGPVAWADVTGKPVTFPPAEHSHAYSSLSGLPSLFSGAYADLSGKPVLGSAAAAAVSDFALAAHVHSYASLTGIPATFAPTAHNQAWSTITATPTTLAGYGITDAALAGHSHAYSSLTGLPSLFSGAFFDLTGIPGSFPPSAHGHAQSDITGLVSDLAAKQPTLVSASNIKTINGVSILGAGDLAVAGGAGAPLALWDFWEETRFTHTNAVAGPFIATAISSGSTSTATGLTADGYYNYSLNFRTPSTGVGGYRWHTTNLTTDFMGTVSHKFIFGMRLKERPETTVGYIGYHDIATNAALATDAVAFRVAGSLFTPTIAVNGVITFAPAGYAMVTNTTYSFDIEVNAAGTDARFRIYEGTNPVPVYDVSSGDVGMPNTPLRAFGCGVMLFNTATVTTDVCNMHYMGFGTIAGFMRARG